jgi:signal transduction histidine kinase
MRDGIRSVEKLNRMIQRLLDFSRAARAAYSFEKVDLQRLVQGVIRSLGYQLNKRGVRVEINASLRSPATACAQRCSAT